MLSPGSLTNTLEDDKQIQNSSVAIQLLRNLYCFKGDENNLKLKEKHQASGNDLLSNLHKIMNSRDTSVIGNVHPNIHTPLYSYEPTGNAQYLNSLLQPPETYKSSVMAGTYTNGFAISPVLYNNAAFNNDVQNIYSSHANRIGNQSASIFNNPLTPLTGIPHSQYYQGFQPQTINPLMINPSTPIITTPYAGTSNININNLGASLIKLNNQSNGQSLQLQSKSCQPSLIKIEPTETSQQKGLQSAFTNSISLKDMIKKK